MSEQLTQRILAIAQTKNYPKKTLILQEGQVANDGCLVTSGLAIAYYLNEGKDITSRFMDEGFVITSWISFYTRRPGQ